MLAERRCLLSHASASIQLKRDEITGISRAPLTRVLIGDLIDRVRCGPDCGDHFLHATLDVAYLRVNFLDKLVLGARKIFDSLALFTQLGQESVLLGRNLVHPQKANAPAEHVRNGQPKGYRVLAHSSILTEHYRPSASQGNFVQTSEREPLAVESFWSNRNQEDRVSTSGSVCVGRKTVAKPR